jgi:hypothetical protein
LFELLSQAPIFGFRLVGACPFGLGSLSFGGRSHLLRFFLDSLGFRPLPLGFRLCFRGLGWGWEPQAGRWVVKLQAFSISLQMEPDNLARKPTVDGPDL